MLKRQATAAFLLPGRSLSLLNPLECALPRRRGFCTILGQISPLDSALTDGPLVSPLECALTETGGRGLPPPGTDRAHPWQNGSRAFLTLFFSGQNAKKGVYHGTRAARWKRSCNSCLRTSLGTRPMSSTTVPLTLQVLKPTMPLHDIPGGSGAGESPAKSSTGGTCTFSEQARLASSLTLV